MLNEWDPDRGLCGHGKKFHDTSAGRTKPTEMYGESWDRLRPRRVYREWVSRHHIDTFLRSIARSTGVVARGRGSVRSFYHPIDRHARHGTEKTRNIDGAAGYISLIIPSSFSERPNIGTFWHLRQIAGMERLGIYFAEKEGTLPDLGTLGETQ